MDEGFVKNFPALAEKSVFLSDGSMDVAGAVEVYANQIAKQIAPVRVTGNYGSEILRGSVAFKPSRNHDDLYDPEFASRMIAAGETYDLERRGNRVSFIAFKQVPWFHCSR